MSQYLWFPLSLVQNLKKKGWSKFWKKSSLALALKKYGIRTCTVARFVAQRVLDRDSEPKWLNALV